MKQKTVLVPISSGIIVRNFCCVPNGVLEHLTRAFSTVVLLVPHQAVETMKRDYAADQVKIIGVELEKETNGFLKSFVSFFTTYLLLTISGRGLARDGVRLDVPVAGGILGRLNYWLKVFVANSFGKSKWVRKVLSVKLDLLVYNERLYKEIFNTYKPDLVFLPNVHNWLDISILREAQRQNVFSVGMPGSWDHFPKRYRALHPNHLLVWHHTQKWEAVEYQSYEQSDVTVTGVPYYDTFSDQSLHESRDSFCARLGLDPNKKIVLFSSESVYTPDDGDIADQLIKAIDSKELKETQLFVRPYPGVDIEHKKFDFLNKYSDVYIDWIEPNYTFSDPWYPALSDIAHFVNLLRHADVVVNSYSSIAVEASAFGKTVLGVNYDGYKDRPLRQSVKRFAEKIHLQHVRETGAVEYIDNQKDLIPAVKRALNEQGSRPQLAILSTKLCGPIDGFSAKRLVCQLKTLNQND